jgi:hypothetical protein
MSRNSIVIAAAVAALGLPCLAPGAAAAGVALSHVTAFSGATRLVTGFNGPGSPQSRPPAQKPLPQPPPFFAGAPGGSGPPANPRQPQKQ